MALRPALFEARGFRVLVVRACGIVATLGARWRLDAAALEVDGDG